MADGVLRNTAEIAALAARIQLPTLLGNFRQPTNAVLLSAPFSFGIDTADLIRLRHWSDEPRTWTPSAKHFELVIRMVRINGEGQVSALDFDVVPDRAAHTEYVQLEAGAIQTVSINWGGSVLSTLPGPVYVVVDLIRGTPDGAQKVIGTFIAGYVGPGLPCTWPGSPIVGPMEGPGYQALYLDGATLGNEFAATVPVGAVWRVRSIGAEFVASAAAASRRPKLGFLTDLGSLTSRGLLPCPRGVNASETFFCTWMEGAALSDTFAFSPGVAPLPFHTMLRAGDGFATSTENLQGGDQYTVVDISVDLYLEPLP